MGVEHVELSDVWAKDDCSAVVHVRSNRDSTQASADVEGRANKDGALEGTSSKQGSRPASRRGSEDVNAAAEVVLVGRNCRELEGAIKAALGALLVVDVRRP